MTDIQLIETAKKAMLNAYSPYSKVTVGAALEGESGKVYVGCNVENSSYGATICAERTAVTKAVSEGEKKFKRIAVVGNLGVQMFPCGICLQVLSEFAPDIDVILEQDGKLFKYTLKQLIPKAFSM